MAAQQPWMEFWEPTNELRQSDFHRAINYNPEADVMQYYCYHKLPQYQLLVGMAELKPDDNVLDVGCGVGFIANLVCEQQGGVGHLTILDKSPMMMEYTCGTLAMRLEAMGLMKEPPAGPFWIPDDLNTICDDFDRPEVRARLRGQFDVVFAIQFLNHYQGDAKIQALRALIELTKPGGRVVIDFTEENSLAGYGTTRMGVVQVALPVRGQRPPIESFTMDTRIDKLRHEIWWSDHREDARVRAQLIGLLARARVLCGRCEKLVETDDANNRFDELSRKHKGNLVAIDNERSDLAEAAFMDWARSNARNGGISTARSIVTVEHFAFALVLHRYDVPF